MKKFFSFRSFASSNGNSNAAPPPTNGKVYWETPWESGAENKVNDKAKGKSQSPRDTTSKSAKRLPESQDSVTSCLKRSLSFSSPTICSDLGERDLNCLSDLSRSPANNLIPLHATDYPIRCRSSTPERWPQPKRGDQGVMIRNTSGIDNLDSPSSSRGYFGSSGNSPYSTPVPLKCREVYLTEAQNKILDRYIDGEQQERRPRNNSKSDSPGVGSDSLIEKRLLPSSRRQLRMQSTAPVSPASRKERLRSNSFTESRHTNHQSSNRGWLREDARPASPQKLSKRVVERLCQAFPRKSKTKLQEYDSETTTTVEDIYEDYSLVHPSLNSNGIAQEISSSEHISLCHPSDPLYENTNQCFTNGFSSLRKQSFLLLDDTMGVEHTVQSSKKEDDIDMELCRKGKEAEERVMLLSEELQQVKLQNCGFSVSALLQTIRNITNDRRNLALEVTAQIQSRIAERASASDALKRANVDFDRQRRRLEKERSELQLSLEKELDRRSCEWSLKLEKFQLEEQRLRERVCELAEQNVSLQREVASMKGREVETKSRITDSEAQLNEVMTRLEETRAENHSLQQSMLELQEHCNGAETDRDCIKRSYKEKEKENKELQKVVTRLQRICSEQEKTIIGLRQGLGDEASKQYSERGNLVAKSQMEQLRLTGVEQMLRKEIESCRHEVESLRHENINLLDRLRASGNGGGFSSFKLSQELGARIDCLQNQCLLLLDENTQLCGKLLEFIKSKACRSPDDPSFNQVQDVNNEFDGYSIIECDMKLQSFARRVESLKRSLQTSSVILQEKSNLNASESQSQSKVSSTLLQPLTGQASECEVELELKAEKLVTKVLREKLCSKELELEQLQAELATSARGHDILRCEVQRAQDSVSSLTHKLKDLELQVLRKDENITQIQNELQECMKELTSTKTILPKVTEERDLLWEEVKLYSEKTMLLNCEVNSLKKKIEALDEDILIKEGQITILKDSIGDKPFDILFDDPMLLKELTLQ